MTSEVEVEERPALRLRSAAKRTAFMLDDLRPSPAGDVVLAYHRIGGRTVSPVDLSTSMFERQMANLNSDHRLAAMDELVDRHHSEILYGRESAQSQPPVVAVTIDDGTADFVEVALPILDTYRVPVTLYLATEFVDSGRQYPAEGRPVSWAGLRDAMSTGLVTVGAHTHSHRLLDRCSFAEARVELDRCNERIEDELGVSPVHFAYPKACAASGQVAALVKSRYRSAAVAGTRPNVLGQTDLWQLSRSPIQNADAWEGFQRKVAGGMRTEDDLRRVINLVRYRGSSS